MAPSHYLNQCWLIEVLWHLHEVNFRKNNWYIYDIKMCLKISYIKLHPNLSGAKELIRNWISSAPSFSVRNLRLWSFLCCVHLTNNLTQLPDWPVKLDVLPLICQIAKALGLTSIRHRSDTKVSDRCLIDAALRVFAIRICHCCNWTVQTWQKWLNTRLIVPAGSSPMICLIEPWGVSIFSNQWTSLAWHFVESVSVMLRNFYVAI